MDSASSGYLESWVLSYQTKKLKRLEFCSLLPLATIGNQRIVTNNLDAMFGGASDGLLALVVEVGFSGLAMLTEGCIVTLRGQRKLQIGGIDEAS